MKRPALPLALLLATTVAGTSMWTAVCNAQDTGERSGVPGAIPVKEVPKSDAHALAILESAADTQGGAALAAPGALKSFRVEFSRVWIRVEKTQEDGTKAAGSDELSRLDIDWKRNEKHPASLRTYWETNTGKVLTLAVIGDEDYYWENDGEQTTQIQETTHPDDVDQIHRYRRLAESLLDVAVLHKLRRDGSVWKMIDDPAHAGVALRRTPAEGAGGLHLTIWVDQESSAVTWVRLDPIQEGASTLEYEFTYMEDRPVVAGADLRFPQRVIVHEQRVGEAKPQMVMKLFLRRVFFNSVVDDAFYPPKQ